MFDCGNSATRKSKKDKKNDCSASVTTSTSSYRSSRSRYEAPRHCIEEDVICDLIDSLRYSGRTSFNDDRRRNRILEYIDDKRHSGHKSSEKSRSYKDNSKSEMDVLRFDGGSSKSAYTSGPIFDFGSSTANLPESNECIPSKEGKCNINDVSPGNNLSLPIKLLVDGGGAAGKKC